ncbi:MAG: response regulator transcription factor [Burkholderiaceae bacterium]|nr:MAG: response regulator transcription factor [Burkholderiaceae bacterium]
MTELKILIVDDEEPARARLRTLLSDIAGDLPHRLVGQAEGAEAALALCAQHQPDVVLLDIQMPGVSGLELARHLRPAEQAQSRPWVIFVTAYDEYAVKAFDVHALDYLLKPVRASRLLEALQHVLRVHDSQAGAAQDLNALAPVRQHLSIHERGRVFLVPVRDVIYFKAEMKYITVRTAEREYISEESLVALEQEFAEQFVRIHRNALIAKQAIAGFERVATGIDQEEDNRSTDPHWEVVLKGIPEHLPVSRRQWSTVKALLKQ